MQRNLPEFPGLLYSELLISDTTKNKIWSGYLRQANMMYVMLRIRPYMQNFKSTITWMLYYLDDKYIFKTTMAFIRYLSNEKDTKQPISLMNNKLTLNEVYKLLSTGLCSLGIKKRHIKCYYNVADEYECGFHSSEEVRSNLNINPNHRKLHITDARNSLLDPETAVDQKGIQAILKMQMEDIPLLSIKSPKMHEYVLKNWDLYGSRNYIGNSYFSWDIITHVYEITHDELLKEHYLLVRAIENGFRGVKGFNWQAPASALQDIEPNSNSGLYRYAMVKKNIYTLPSDLYSVYKSIEPINSVSTKYMQDNPPDLWDILAYIELKPDTKSVYLYPYQGNIIELDLKVELADFI